MSLALVASLVAVAREAAQVLYSSLSEMDTSEMDGLTYQAWAADRDQAWTVFRGLADTERHTQN